MKFEYMILEEKSVIETIEKFCAQRNPIENEIIRISKGEAGSPMILGNKDGWIYLAKICIEMAYASEKYPEFHIHRNSDFFESTEESKDSIGFFQMRSEKSK